jgi:hypothetical protein
MPSAEEGEGCRAAVPDAAPLHRLNREAERLNSPPMTPREHESGMSDGFASTIRAATLITQPLPSLPLAGLRHGCVTFCQFRTIPPLSKPHTVFGRSADELTRGKIGEHGALEYTTAKIPDSYIVRCVCFCIRISERVVLSAGNVENGCANLCNAQ